MPEPSPIYISRNEDADLQAAFDRALQTPEAQPVLFHISGIGGVGKSTLRQKLQKNFEDKASFTAVSFGETEWRQGGETPALIALMHYLYQHLPKPASLLLQNVENLPAALQSDPFLTLYERYDGTLKRLQTEPLEGKKSVEADQIKAVGELVKIGLSLVLPVATLGVVDKATSEKLGEGTVKLAATALSAKDLLLQHKATKTKQDLIDLMQNPLPQLTEAFVRGLAQRTKVLKKAIVLILDTYEKAEAECPNGDTWLWRSLLSNTDIQEQPVRIVVAGRYDLPSEGWNKLSDKIYRCKLEKFDPKQTEAYREQTRISTESETVFRVTKGLPKYLDWMRQKQARGEALDFSHGEREIADLLLEGFSKPQKTIIQLAAFCRSFDRPLIKHLAEFQKFNFLTAADQNQDWFGWLKKLYFVEFVQSKYRFDDVARDVFRRQFYVDDRNQFFDIHHLLADYYESEANREVKADRPPSVKYRNNHWQEYVAESLYHLAFSRQEDFRVQFLSHLFATRYFGQDDLVASVLNTIASEVDLLSQDSPLNSETQKFLRSISPVTFFGRSILAVDEIAWDKFKQIGLSKRQIEKSLQVAFSEMHRLEGVAKFAALLYKARRSTKAQGQELLLQAKQQAEQLITDADPEFSSGMFLWDLGDSFDKLGCHEEAIASYDKALEINPNSHEAWYNRGNTLASLGRYAKVIASYDKALEIKPASYEVWNNRGNTLDSLGRYVDAIASYDKAIEINPNSHEAWYNRGNTLASLGRYAEAIVSYDQAIKIRPSSHEALHGRGFALANLGRNEEAFASYNNALKIKSDDPEVWNNRGVALANLGRNEEAIASYDKALEIKSDYHEAWSNRGAVLYNLGRYEEAISSYDKALEIKPDKYEVWSDRGVALSNLERDEEAIASYNRALEFKSDLYAAWYNRGSALRKLERYDEAFTSYDKAVKVNPSAHKAWNDRGATLSKLGRNEEAIASYDKALEIKPGDPDSYYNKACAYALQGKIDSALENLQQAIQLNPDEYREMAKTDKDFDGIRTDPRFQASI